MASEPTTNDRVKKKLYSMVLSWHRQFKDDPRMALVAGLYKTVRPGESTEEYRERVRRQEEASRLRQEKAALERSKLEAQRDAEREAERLRKEEEKRKKKQKPGQRRPPFNFEQEKPKIMTSIAQLTQSSNSLINTLQHIDRQKENVAENASVLTAIEKIKRDRTVVVRYTQLIQHDPTGEYISSLLSTNELAIKALRLFDYYCQPAEHDSDDEKLADATADVKRMALGPAGQVDRLQERQAIEVERAQRGEHLSPVSNSGAFDDLADLDFSASGLQAPLQPGRVDNEHYDPGTLSDFSDYDSGEERKAKQQAFDSADPFADPFDDVNEGVSTPGIVKRQQWAEI